MTIRIWITRTEPAAQRSADAWREAGFEPVIAPLLMVHPIPQTESISDQATLIFTSAHGVRHCGIKGDGRLIYTVGDATACVAREYGFHHIVSAGGDWKSLIQAIEITRNPIVHMSGETIRGAVVETLIERGLEARRQIVYTTNPVTNWPVDLEQIEAVALYSPMASSTLMTLPKRDLSNLTAYCLSPNVAAPLERLKTRIAERPTEAALIACSRPAEV